MHGEEYYLKHHGPELGAAGWGNKGEVLHDRGRTLLPVNLTIITIRNSSLITLKPISEALLETVKIQRFMVVASQTSLASINDLANAVSYMTNLTHLYLDFKYHMTLINS